MNIAAVVCVDKTQKNVTICVHASTKSFVPFRYCLISTGKLAMKYGVTGHVYAPYVSLSHSVVGVSSKQYFWS